jgi:hypothetical protein
MSRTIRWSTLALAITAGAVACGNGGEPGRERDRAGQSRVDFGPTAAYERRLIFLGPGQRLPTAAIVDFGALSDEDGLRRGVRARLADGNDWTRLMDAGWSMDRMREPWRLVPHGPLRLIVGDGGEVAALVIRGDVEVRIEPGGSMAELTPDPGTQLMLRQGRIGLGGSLVSGVLLDIQTGRSLDGPPHGSALPGAPPTGGDDGATPWARPGVEALLAGEAGFYMVFAGTASGTLAWLRHGQQDEVRRGARLTAVEWELGSDGVRVPSAWQVVGPDDLTGELVADASDGVDVSGAGDVEGLGYAIVSGWILDRGVHRDVFGLVRHVR